jgi:hypothetical protein
MASNSKLNSAQKTALKHFKAKMSENMAFASNGRLTLLVRVMPNCVHISTALASPDEIKIRKKVGQFYVTKRMFNESYVVVPFPDVWDYGAETIAEHFAELLS